MQYRPDQFFQFPSIVLVLTDIFLLRLEDHGAKSVIVFGRIDLFPQVQNRGPVRFVHIPFFHIFKNRALRRRYDIEEQPHFIIVQIRDSYHLRVVLLIAARLSFADSPYRRQADSRPKCPVRDTIFIETVDPADLPFRIQLQLYQLTVRFRIPKTRTDTHEDIPILHALHHMRHGHRPGSQTGTFFLYQKISDCLPDERLCQPVRPQDTVLCHIREKAVRALR